MSTVQISAADVNKLRQTTGAGMMDCKKALVESGGDFEAAIDYLRKKGQKVAAKRADREANEGVAIALTSEDGKKGVVLSLSSETDFVAKNEEFINVAKSIAEKALEVFPSSKEDLDGLDVNGNTVKNIIDEQVAKIGEKIEITRYETMEAEAVIPYIHAGYRIGVLVAMNQGLTEEIDGLGKDVAMQVAAMNPVALDKEAIDPAIVERELAIGMEQAKAEGKPENMLEKISQGKLNKFFKENTLVNQQFVKDGSKTVAQVVSSIHPELKVTAFTRIQIGS